MPMDVPAERVPENASPELDDDLPAALSPLDPTESYDLHRAINERRAQVENPELLRRLRSL
jgi:hypothetical protein